MEDTDRYWLHGFDIVLLHLQDAAQLFDGCRLEQWRRYKCELQVWNINGTRKYLVRAEKTRS